MIVRFAHITYKAARRAVIAVVGATVLLLGIVMIVTPGPAIILIPLGLAILGIEFAWARYWLKHARERISGINSNDLGARAEAHRERVSR